MDVSVIGFDDIDFESEAKQMVNKIRAINPNAKIYWVQIFSEGSAEEYRKKIADEKSALRAWLRQNAPKASIVGSHDVALNAVSHSTSVVKAPVGIFIEETGKTGFAHLIDLAEPKLLALINPGDAVELRPDGPRLAAHSSGVHIGYVEPRVAARLLKLIADGNKYAAGVTSLGDKDVRIIIREIYQDPRNYGKVSFPTAAKSTDLRPYTKGTLVREEMELEEDLEDDEEDEEIEDLDRVLPPESTTEEAFEEEQDELDES